MPGNSDARLKFQSMEGACGTCGIRSTWRGTHEEDGPEVLQGECDGKPARDVEGVYIININRSDISSGNALLDKGLTATPYRIR